MSTPKRRQARRLPARLTRIEDGELLLQDFAELSALVWARPDFTAQQAAHLTFTGVHCKQGRWGGRRLHGVRCTDTRFEGCDLANATWEQVIAYRVEFLTSQLVGFTALEAHRQHVHFQGCNSQFAGFRFATFKTVRFGQCDLRYAA